MSETVISIKNLTKQYGKQTVLDDVNIEIDRGSIVGLIGPNGAGKTTIMKTLGGLIIPTSGQISIYGGSDEKSLTEARRRMSFMIETPYAKENFTARENLEKQRIQKGIPDKKVVDEILKSVNLEDTGKKPVKKFSLGMRQRLGLANALMTRPEIMVLDEPVNGLDPEGIVSIREMLLKLNKEEHVTILISSHLLSELSLLCTDYLFINNGKIIRRLSNSQLQKECKNYIQLDTDNNPVALKVIKDECGYSNAEIAEDGKIRLYEGIDDIRNISKTLFLNDVIPVGIELSSINLEKYYLDIIESDNESEA